MKESLDRNGTQWVLTKILIEQQCFFSSHVAAGMLIPFILGDDPSNFWSTNYSKLHKDFHQKEHRGWHFVWYWFTFIFGQRMLFQMTPTLVYYNNKNFLKMVKGDKLQNDNTSIVSLRINILYCRFRKHLL